MRASLFVLLLACGGKPAASTGPAAPAGQDLIDATSRLCAAPMRAEGDLEFHTDDAAAKATVLDKHLKDGVTNARVLALIESWKGKPADARVADLDQLTHDALLSSKCRLREVWTAPGPTEAGS